MRTVRYVICDVFTERALAGNQLAVFTNASSLDTLTMQSLAKEMNFSESTFVLRPERGGQAKIRIFTPAMELPFAGHPTLGSAFVIGSMVQLDVIELETGIGTVPVRLEREGARVTFGWMTQRNPKAEPFAHAGELLAALGMAGSELPIVEYDNGARHVYVAAISREVVAALEPDFARLSKLPVVGFNVFAGSGTSYKTRMFAPRKGVNEDPATGSAAGPLALHLARHGRIRYGDEIKIEQGAELGRPSTLYARVEGAIDDLRSVEVGGSAVLVARGEFRLPS